MKVTKMNIRFYGIANYSSNTWHYRGNSVWNYYKVYITGEDVDKVSTYVTSIIIQWH